MTKVWIPNFACRLVPICLLAFAGLASADTISLTYTVEPWISPYIPTCQANSPIDLFCSIASVGSFTNTLSLTTGVSQEAELFPVVFTVPAGGGLAGEQGPLLPLIDFSYTDTTTGFTASEQVEYKIEYNTAGSNYLYDSQFGINDISLPGLVLEIRPVGTLGPLSIGGTVTYAAMATFVTPPPAPEPATFLVTGVGFCLVALRWRSCKRSAGSVDGK